MAGDPAAALAALAEQRGAATPLRPPSQDDLSDTTVVIPARDEAQVIGQTLAALAGQGPGLRVLLVDDSSTDGTAEVARAVSGLDLKVIPGQPLPEGWSGKVWALEQGVRQVETPLTLMIDADVALSSGVVAALKAQMRRGGYQFVSVMASLSMCSFWEKLLNPSFTYFFKMLYPFRLAKTSNPHFYSAAGGCIMLETRVFPAIGGLASIRGELIDDCALARQVKRARFRTWIGQSRAVRSTPDLPRFARHLEYGGPLGLYPVALLPPHPSADHLLHRHPLPRPCCELGRAGPPRTGAGSAGLGDDDRQLSADSALLRSEPLMGPVAAARRCPVRRHDLEFRPALLARRAQPLEREGVPVIWPSVSFWTKNISRHPMSCPQRWDSARHCGSGWCVLSPIPTKCPASGAMAAKSTAGTCGTAKAASRWPASTRSKATWSPR